jgi:hypothetical protein
MTFVVNDRVKETITANGAGNLALGSSIDGFETFATGIGGSNTTYYAIYHLSANEWEVGVGDLDATAANITRTTVISSSNSDSHVNFTSGTKYIFCTNPASKSVLEDTSNNVNIGNNLTLGGTVDGVDIAARDAILTSTTTTATAALPKAGGEMSGNITMAGTETVDGRDLSVDGTKLDGIATAATAVGGANGVDFNDDVKIRLGTGNDVELFHDSNNSFIKNNTGTLKINSDSTVLRSNDDSAAMANFTQGGAVELFHNGSKKAETVAGGLTVTGTLTATTLSGAISGNISQLTNDSGYTTNTGTVTSVATGNGLTGGTITTTGTLSMTGSFSGSFTATSNVTAYSDERIKYNITTIENALDKVLKLRGVHYTHKQDDEENIGVIAQEVEKVVPELVSIAKTKEKPFEHLDNVRTMKYGNTVGLLIEAIKDLKEYIDKNKCECSCCKKEV